MLFPFPSARDKSHPLSPANASVCEYGKRLAKTSAFGAVTPDFIQEMSSNVMLTYHMVVRSRWFYLQDHLHVSKLIDPKEDYF